MNTRFIKATFVDSGDKIYIDPDATVKVVINALRPDGEAKGFDGEVNQDGTVTVPLHSWMLELVGTVTCDISVIDTESHDNKKLTTTSFTLLVEKAAWGGDGITSDPQYDLLIELMNTCEAAVDACEEATQRCLDALEELEDNPGGGGSSIVVDSELSLISENPVQNKAVTGKIYDITQQVENLLPTKTEVENAREDYWGTTHENVGEAIRTTTATLSGDISKIAGRVANLEGNVITVDEKMSYDSTNPVQNKVVMAEIASIGSLAGTAIQVAEEVEEAVEEASNAVGVLDGRVSSVESTVADVKSIANAARNTASNAQTGANSAINKSVAANDKADALGMRVDAVEQDLSGAIELVNDFNGDLGDLNTKVFDLNASVQSIETQILPDYDERISELEDKSSTETWTFTLEDGSTVTKKVVVA